MHPQVICVTPTYGRVHLLQEMLWCWVNQSYGDKSLLIVNDQPNLTIECDIPCVTVINVPERFVALGAKRNFMAKHIPADATFVVTMDDDDLFMPDYIKRLVWTLFEEPLGTRSKNKITYVAEDNVFKFSNTTWPCYGASAFWAEDFRKFWMQDIYTWGEDVDMLRRHKVRTVEVDGGVSDFIYRRGMGVAHASDNAGLTYMDPTHQAMAAQRMQSQTAQYDKPTVVKLEPSISEQSLVLFNEIDKMRKENALVHQ